MITGRPAVILLGTALLLTACVSSPPRPLPEATAAARIAQDQLGAPYRAGGERPGGFDCSGLIHYSYRQAGVPLPRSVAGLRTTTREIAAGQARAGDLVYFRDWLRTRHVGLYLGDGRFIHAPSSGGRVRIDRLDDPYWRDRLRSVGRVTD